MGKFSLLFLFAFMFFLNVDIALSFFLSFFLLKLPDEPNYIYSDLSFSLHSRNSSFHLTSTWRKTKIDLRLDYFFLEFLVLSNQAAAPGFSLFQLIETIVQQTEGKLYSSVSWTNAKSVPFYKVYFWLKCKLWKPTENLELKKWWDTFLFYTSNLS